MNSEDVVRHEDLESLELRSCDDDDNDSVEDLEPVESCP